MSLGSTFTKHANPQMNAVDFVLAKVGANVSGTNGYINQQGAPEAAMSSLTGLAAIQEAKTSLTARLPENNGAAPLGGKPAGGAVGGFLKGQILQGVTIGAAAILAGPIGATAATAGFAAVEGLNQIFGGGASNDASFTAAVINTAIHGGGEMGLHELGSKDKKGKGSEQTYTDTMGDTYTMGGQKTAAPTATQMAANTPARPMAGNKQMSEAAAAAFEMFSEDDIRRSVAEIGRQEKVLLQQLGTSMKRMGMSGNVDEAYAKINAEHTSGFGLKDRSSKLAMNDQQFELPELKNKPAANMMHFGAPRLG